MRNLLRLLIKYYAVFLFLILEGAALFLIVQHNNFQHATFINASSGLIGFVNEQWTEVTDFFLLKNENEKLRKENLRLRRLIEYQQTSDPDYFDEIVIADVVNSSVFRQKNYLTINKGENHGIEKQMAVISPQGVIGVVEESSSHYATVIPIINTNFNLSAKIKRNDYFGSLSWNGQSYRVAQLDDIPTYVNAEVGDTIVTSGFSASFPAGKLVGVISHVNRDPNSAFLNIDIKLGSDFKKIQTVYVYKNPLAQEQVNLENDND